MQVRHTNMNTRVLAVEGVSVLRGKTGQEETGGN